MAIHTGAIPIRLKSSADKDPNPLRLLLAVEGVANYLIQGGSEILLDPLPGSDPEAVRLFLHGPAFGAVLHQRGMFPLHASAVVTPQGAVAFAGPSGSGKSTIAAAFHRMGYPLLADEICAIAVPFVFPASPRLFLWRDSLQQLGVEHLNLRPIRSKSDKFIVPLTTGFPQDPVPIRVIYILETNDRLGLISIEGLERLAELHRNTYRLDFIRRMHLDRQHLKKLCELSDQPRMARITRPAGVFCIGELVEMVQRDLGL